MTDSIKRGARAALALAGVLVAAAAGAANANASSPDAAAFANGWFKQTADAVTTAAISAQASNSRIWALSWSAANDALRSSSRAHHGRRGHHTGEGIYAEAAVATALHDVLVTLVPAQKPQLDAALTTSLGTLPDGTAKTRGSERGAKAAADELAARAGDGLDFASVNQPFSPGPAVTGAWQFTPPFGPPVQAGLPDAKPFYLGRADRFRPGPAPGPGSQTYRDSFNESKAIGGTTSATRTAAQTDLAKWISQSSLNQYTQVLAAILADSPNRSLAWKVSLVAAFHTITVDAQIAVYEAKYHYLRWRPYTAIRAADSDGDAQTTGDPTWTPLINSPQHPEYPSGHLTYAGAAQQVLTAFVGPNAPASFSATSPNAPGVVYTYGPNAWAKLVTDNDNGRVWSGIHFRFSDQIGAALGRRVADYDLDHVRGHYVGL